MFSRGFLEIQSGYLIKRQQRVNKSLALEACYSLCNGQTPIRSVKAKQSFGALSLGSRGERGLVGVGVGVGVGVETG